MKNVALYIATSLDGFIADRDGGVGWLDAVATESGEDYGYADFYASVGALVMGRVTYEQVLGFGDWPYPGKPTFVFSHAPPEGEHPDVTFVSGDPAEVVASLREQVDGDLWLVGGGGLVASFRAAGLIDEYILSVIPVLLGEGIPLFEGAQPHAALRLVEAQSYASGVVQLRYAAE